MRATLIIAAAVLSISGAILHAQAPATVQTVAPAPVVTPANAAAASGRAPSATLQSLQQIHAANEELLKRQAATLQQLEEIEKTADQIRILTQRS
jgi:hypothetical protein